MSEDHPLTIADAVREASAVLRRGGVAEARREAGALLAAAAARDRTFILTHAGDELAAAELDRFRDFVRRRATGEPFQYITGHQEFYGLDLRVTPDVLIPRPETELLVETALALLAETPAPLICDVGTGSGCIAIALLTARADARAVALDISPAALSVAAQNAHRHSVAERLAFVVSDCFSGLENPAAAATSSSSSWAGPPFKMIVSNPPYVAERDMAGLQREVREYEPRIALTPGGSGLRVIRQLLAAAPRFLAAGGHLVFEIGYNQHQAVRELIDPRVWAVLDVHEDLQGIPRIVALRREDSP